MIMLLCQSCSTDGVNSVIDCWQNTPFSIKGRRTEVNDSIVKHQYNLAVMDRNNDENRRIKILDGEVLLFDSCLYYTNGKTPFLFAPLFDFKLKEKDSISVFHYFESADPPPYKRIYRDNITITLVQKKYNEILNDVEYVFDIKDLELKPFHTNRLVVTLSYKRGLKGVILIYMNEIFNMEGDIDSSTIKTLSLLPWEDKQFL